MRSATQTTIETRVLKYEIWRWSDYKRWLFSWPKGETLKPRHRYLLLFLALKSISSFRMPRTPQCIVGTQSLNPLEPRHLAQRLIMAATQRPDLVAFTTKILMYVPLVATNPPIVELRPWTHDNGLEFLTKMTTASPLTRASQTLRLTSLYY